MATFGQEIETIRGTNAIVSGSINILLTPLANKNDSPQAVETKIDEMARNLIANNPPSEGESQTEWLEFLFSDLFSEGEDATVDGQALDFQSIHSIDTFIPKPDPSNPDDPNAKKRALLKKHLKANYRITQGNLSNNMKVKDLARLYNIIYSDSGAHVNTVDLMVRDLIHFIETKTTEKDFDLERFFHQEGNTVSTKGQATGVDNILELSIKEFLTIFKKDQEYHSKNDAAGRLAIIHKDLALSSLTRGELAQPCTVVAPTFEKLSDCKKIGVAPAKIQNVIFAAGLLTDIDGKDDDAAQIYLSTSVTLDNLESNIPSLMEISRQIVTEMDRDASFFSKVKKLADVIRYYDGQGVKCHFALSEVTRTFYDVFDKFLNNERENGRLTSWRLGLYNGEDRDRGTPDNPKGPVEKKHCVVILHNYGEIETVEDYHPADIQVMRLKYTEEDTEGNIDEAVVGIIGAHLPSGEDERRKRIQSLNEYLTALFSEGGLLRNVSETFIIGDFNEDLAKNERIKIDDKSAPKSLADVLYAHDFLIPNAFLEATPFSESVPLAFLGDSETEDFSQKTLTQVSRAKSENLISTCKTRSGYQGQYGKAYDPKSELLDWGFSTNRLGTVYIIPNETSDHSKAFVIYH